MTPKEEAIELVDKMLKEQEGYYLDNSENAKQCALIAVDYIMRVIDREHAYWEEVKQEIEKL